MAEREGQLASERNVETLGVAQIEISVLQMDIAVAHAAGEDPEQDLAVLGLGKRGGRLGERRSVSDERLADHDLLPSRAAAIRAKSATASCSARRLASMSRFASRLAGSGQTLLRLERSILRRWPKAAAVTFSKTPMSQSGSRFVFGM